MGKCLHTVEEQIFAQQLIMIGSLRCQLHILYLQSTSVHERFQSVSRALTYAYEEINILFFILKLESFRNCRYALLLNEYYFHKQTDQDKRGLYELPGVVVCGFFLDGVYWNNFFLNVGFSETVTTVLDLTYSCN